MLQKWDIPLLEFPSFDLFGMRRGVIEDLIRMKRRLAINKWDNPSRIRVRLNTTPFLLPKYIRSFAILARKAAPKHPASLSLDPLNNAVRSRASYVSHSILACRDPCTSRRTRESNPISLGPKKHVVLLGRGEEAGLAYVSDLTKCRTGLLYCIQNNNSYKMCCKLQYAASAAKHKSATDPEPSLVGLRLLWKRQFVSCLLSPHVMYLPSTIAIHRAGLRHGP